MLWLVALGAAALHGSPRLPSQPTLAARATPRCVAPLLSEPSPVDLDANAAATNAAVSNAAVSNAAAADAAAASGGRVLLGAVTVMYATNYPTIKLMNEMLSDGGAAEVSVLRFLVAALAHVETKQGGTGLSQLALRRPFSAPDPRLRLPEASASLGQSPMPKLSKVARASAGWPSGGCPRLRPASASQPLPRLWPAISGLCLHTVGARSGASARGARCARTSLRELAARARRAERWRVLRRGVRSTGDH